MHVEPEDNRVTMPSTMHRRPPPTGLATSAKPATQTRAPSSHLAAVAAAARQGPPDTLLPGAFPRPDNLLPRPPTAPRPGAAHTPAATRRPRRRIPGPTQMVVGLRRHWRRALVLAIVAVALAMSLVAVRPVVFKAGGRSPSSTAAQEAVATDLLRTIVGGGRALWAPKHSFAKVTPATLSAFSYRVPVVAATKPAGMGQVSMRVVRADELIVATPADGHRCVFARDEPGASTTRFVTTQTTVCRANAAPVQGWTAR